MSYEHHRKTWTIRTDLKVNRSTWKCSYDYYLGSDSLGFTKFRGGPITVDVDKDEMAVHILNRWHAPVTDNNKRQVLRAIENAGVPDTMVLPGT